MDKYIKSAEKRDYTRKLVRIITPPVIALNMPPEKAANYIYQLAKKLTYLVYQDE